LANPLRLLMRDPTPFDECRVRRLGKIGRAHCHGVSLALRMGENAHLKPARASHTTHRATRLSTETPDSSEGGIVRLR
jgi:hypothetical protein